MPAGSWSGGPWLCYASPMITHTTRLRILAVASAISFASLVALTVVDMTSSLVFGLALGVFGTATAGLWDALGVEKRRVDPSVPALPDDVLESARPGRDETQHGGER